MEENQTPTSPIAGEPASLKPGMVVPRGALMGLRATLVVALNQADHSRWRKCAQHGYMLESSEALDTMLATVEQALIQVDTLLGFEQPTEDASEGLTHEDGDFIMAQDADAERTLDAEMRAEMEAERMADAAYEIACEGWTLDPYDGF